MSLRYEKLTICPCCGFKFEGDLRSGCLGCGSRSVGEPLARPEHELPGYGRSLLITVVGISSLLLLLVTIIVALVGRAEPSISLSSVAAAAEAGAWRLKWIGFPLAMISVWMNWRIYGSMRKQPVRFTGMRIARNGLGASMLFAFLMTSLVGITVPERLRQRQRGFEATYRASLYTHNRAFMEYRARFGSFPTDLSDLRNLPDSDGSIANLITQAEFVSYKPWTQLAATQTTRAKSNRLRGAAIQPTNLYSGADDSAGEGVSFTNYELRLAGEDKILGTDDDWLMRDGLILPVSGIESTSIATPSVTSAR